MTQSGPRHAESVAETPYGNPRCMQDVAARNKRKIVKAASAVALVISREVMAFNKNKRIYEVGCQKLGDHHNLCADEQFWGQPVPTHCFPGQAPRTAGAATAFLVAPDLVMTAGHVPADFEFGDMRFVFGHSSVEMPPDDRLRFAASEVYAPARLLACNSGDAPDYCDWALIRLTGVVKARDPLTLTEQRRIDASAEVYVIGHSCALPMKVAGPSPIRSNSAPAFFVSNLATYSGNSGSPVLNASTFQVEGILCSDPDVRDFDGPPNRCKRFIPCSNDQECSGRRVTRASEFAAVVKLARSICA